MMVRTIVGWSPRFASNASLARSASLALLLGLVVYCDASGQAFGGQGAAFPAAEAIDQPAKVEALGLEGLKQTEVTEKGIAESISACVVQIRNSDRLCCLGIIVSDGWVLSKRSELSGSLVCIAADGVEAKGMVVASNPYDDLALIQLVFSSDQSESFQTAITFQSDRTVEPGDVLLSVGQDADQPKIGIASVSPQRIPVKQPACRDCVDLGITVATNSSVVELESQVIKNGSGVPVATVGQQALGTRIVRVYPRTIGERIGLLKEDLLVSINRQPVTNPWMLRRIGGQVRVGQSLDVVVVRSGVTKKLSQTVDHFSRRVYHDRWGGGPFSERRFGFSTTIVHDTLLKPDQCGGPLMDLDGNFVGMNIARSMRVATLAIPTERLVAFLNRVRPELNLGR